MPGTWVYVPCPAGTLCRSKMRNSARHRRTQDLTEHLGEASAPASGPLKQFSTVKLHRVTGQIPVPHQVLLKFRDRTPVTIIQ